MARLIIRCDDIHPRMKWSTFNHFVERLSGIGRTAMLAVIPRCEDDSLWHDPPAHDFWDRMRKLKNDGWVIAQHGYRHLYDNRAINYLGFPNRSEFAGHPYETQLHRLREGVRILASEDLKPDSFIAPGHTFDHTTLRALEALGFRYVSDGYGVWPYSEGRITMVPQLLARPHGMSVGVYTTCFHLDELTIPSIDSIVTKLTKFDVLSLHEGAKLKRDHFASALSRSITAATVNGMRRLRKR